MSAAHDIEDRAARWLLRREEPGWSDDDQLRLDAWLEESVAHKAAYWRLEHGWREADRIRSLGLSMEPAARRLFRSVRWWAPIAVAASLVATIGVGAAWLGSAGPLPANTAARFDTPVGGRRVVPLADGSRVELNTATVMRSTVSQNSRQVWLDRGEAYFEVAHIERQPFVVYAGRRTVTVLGTKFSVRREGDKVTVSVVEGRVRIDDLRAAGAARSATISGGDVAITHGASMLVTARSRARVENTLAWRGGMLTFDQVTLAEAAAEFNRYHTRPIIITDSETANIRIGGTFEVSNVDAFVRLLRDAYGLSVTTESGSVKISR